MNELINSLWVERYRPKKLQELVLSENYRRDFEICIQKKEISSLLLSGSPGSGKTALTRILCSPEGIIQNRDDNVLELNGSAKETRSISYVQDVIEPYQTLLFDIELVKTLKGNYTDTSRDSLYADTVKK